MKGFDRSLVAAAVLDRCRRSLRTRNPTSDPLLGPFLPLRGRHRRALTLGDETHQEPRAVGLVREPARRRRPLRARHSKSPPSATTLSSGERARLSAVPLPKRTIRLFNELHARSPLLGNSPNLIPGRVRIRLKDAADLIALARQSPASSRYVHACTSLRDLAGESSR